MVGVAAHGDGKLPLLTTKYGRVRGVMRHAEAGSFLSIFIFVLRHLRILTTGVILHSLILAGELDMYRYIADDIYAHYSISSVDRKRAMSISGRISRQRAIDRCGISAPATTLAPCSRSIKVCRNDPCSWRFSTPMGRLTRRLVACAARHANNKNAC